jgi:hypothetical protein
MIYATGISLILFNFKKFKTLTIYYTLYLFSLLSILFFFLFGGIFFGIFASLAFYPIYPLEVEAENDKIVIYTKYQGFMGMCCPYEITEKKYYLLEKKITEVNFEQVIDFDKSIINSAKGKTTVKIVLEKYDYELKRNIETDTIIELKTE